MTAIILMIGLALTLGLVVFTIKMGKLIFAAPIIAANMQKGQTIKLEAGKYGLWGETKAYKLNRLLLENPILLNARSEKIPMRYSLSGTTSVSWSSVGRRLLYTFSVSSGEFTFDIEDKPYLKLPIPHPDTVGGVYYFIRKKASIWCYTGFSLGMFGSISSLIATVVLSAIFS
ncbi:hypothetical protein HSX37_01565|uniref:Uncharacterized protein n=1 Tax=Dendrosporobacter quercicolus TaxID=146817 RepID=A0A1G9LKR5_9FIRM|nr:hypothetical protein [Dendrosporobacter quercicolus]NSL46743.1 hypothetical protein [Dendrosporobacter quercicolus DSM 1736]SDL62444.1 hypothetical protein SAMN04488502_101380 [Dendrosporobacter quercicolus]